MAVRAEGISKMYFRKTGGANHFYAVKKMDFTLLDGTVTVLLGRSGSGKTTLLNLLGGLLSPTEGKIYVTSSRGGTCPPSPQSLTEEEGNAASSRGGTCPSLPQSLTEGEGNAASSRGVTCPLSPQSLTEGEENAASSCGGICPPSPQSLTEGEKNAVSSCNEVCAPSPAEGGDCPVSGVDLYSLKEKDLARFRNEHLGVIPQGRAVLDTLNVLENVLLPATLYQAGTAGERAALTEKALALLERLGIGHLESAMPRELSGGELRRVSIARTLLCEPEVILADEPTGDLDDENTALVLELLRAEAGRGAAVLLVTHETEALQYADAAFRMDGGEIVPM